MSAPVLCLWLGEHTPPAARLEAWRTLVAARAASQPVRILDLRTTPTDDPTDAPSDQEARLLDALARERTSPERVPASEMLTALRSARSVIALLDADRAPTAPVVTIDDALLAQSPDTVLTRLRQASLILRA
jgi:hypothetical protein